MDFVDFAASLNVSKFSPDQSCSSRDDADREAASAAQQKHPGPDAAGGAVGP